MISELENKYLFHKNSKTLKKYFTEYEKNNYEKANEQDLNKIIINFYNKIHKDKIENISIALFDDNIADYGFLEDYGYYVIRYDGWGYYILHNYGTDIHKIFIHLANSILNHESNARLQKEHKKIKNLYKEKYPDIKYSESIYNIDYALNKWYTYYEGNIPNEVIKVYQDFINIMTGNIEKQVLSYDKSANRFIYIDKPKTKKLVK